MPGRLAKRSGLVQLIPVSLHEERGRDNGKNDQQFTDDPAGTIRF